MNIIKKNAHVKGFCRCGINAGNEQVKTIYVRTLWLLFSLSNIHVEIIVIFKQKY